MPTGNVSHDPHAAATAAESLLWQRLRRRQMGARFRRAVALGPFVADFACLARRLTVECDASRHRDSPYDLARDARLVAAGWRVLRFWNHDVLDHTDAVCAAILAALAAPVTRPGAIRLPSPRCPSPGAAARGAASREAATGGRQVPGDQPPAALRAKRSTKVLGRSSSFTPFSSSSNSLSMPSALFIPSSWIRPVRE